MDGFSLFTKALHSFVLVSVLILFMFVLPCQADKPQSIYFILDIHESWQLYQIDSDTSDFQQTIRTNDDVLALSITAGGDNLLLTSSDRINYLLDLNTKKEKKLITSMSGMVDAVLSKDKKRLLYSLSTAGSNDANHIWVADITTNEITQLTHMEGMQHSPTWSHDDKSIIFISGEGGQNEDIWRLDVANGSLNQLTGGQLYNFEPSCSINNEIAFSSNRSGDYEIWTMDLSGGNLRQLTHSPGMDSQPSWSPDGQHLVYVSSRDGDPTLYIMDREGKSSRRLSPAGLICRNPVWSR